MSAAAPQPVDRRTLEIAWRLVEFSRENVRTLEVGATRVGAAQLAGLIALWTQLYTFNEPVPQGLAVTALIILIFSVLLLAVAIMPRQLAKFWGAVATRDVLSEPRPISPAGEAALVGELRRNVAAQILRLRHRIRLSVALAAAALAFVALAYAIEKAYRGVEEPSSKRVSAILGAPPPSPLSATPTSLRSCSRAYLVNPKRAPSWSPLALRT